MSWWTIFWWVLAAAVLYAVLVVVRAIQMHFALKKELQAAGVQFAERKKKTDA